MDVPNASLMIIENAERLGLAQLHQLRGPGRARRADSRCVLLYRAAAVGEARARLAALRETSDGFEIARRDLELRGPGEVLGTRQTGAVNLRVADLVRDRALLTAPAGTGEPRWSATPRRRWQALIDRWLGRGLGYGEV